MIEIPCKFDPPHVHQYPDDWDFGGASGTDPRADRRYRATTYTYVDADLTFLHITQVPLCNDQALDEFTKIANMGRDFNPVWLQAKRPDGSVETLPWLYDKATDELSPR